MLPPVANHDGGSVTVPECAISQLTAPTDDVVIAVHCPKCRTATFFNGVKDPIAWTMVHYVECGTNDLRVIELITSADNKPAEVSEPLF